MVAIEPTNVRAIRGMVVDQIEGTTAKNYMMVEIHATTTAASNTYDVSDDLSDVTGIAFRLALSIDEGIVATADTWSGTTITFASHSGSGRYRGLFLVEVQ